MTSNRAFEHEHVATCAARGAHVFAWRPISPIDQNRGMDECELCGASGFIGDKRSLGSLVTGDHDDAAEQPA